MLKNLKEWKTTITGIITIALFALVSFNIVSASDSEQIKTAIDAIIEAAGGDLVTFLSVAAVSVGSILHLFARDPKEKK